MKLSVRSMNNVSLSPAEAKAFLGLGHRHDELPVYDKLHSAVGKLQWGESTIDLSFGSEENPKCIVVRSFGVGGEGDERGIRQLELHLTPADLKLIVKEAVKTTLIDLDDL